MRHNKKFNHLGRTAGHRKALLANMASSLIKHKRIKTTVAKAKALQVYIEPLITKSKAANNAVITPVVKTVEVTKKDGEIKQIEKTIKVNSSTPARRLVFSYLKDKDAVKELFGTVASKVADRPGGYTRVLKIGFRQGDAAEMAIIELVDFNEAALSGAKKKETKRSTRRSRRKSSSDAPTTAPVAQQQPKEKVIEESPASSIEETPVAEEETVVKIATEQPIIEDVVPEQEGDIVRQPKIEDVE
ncbi:MAG: 50S ribosomal protein L17 [Dysgonamonadaceae bacterium]|jgi:large subunit ribosomal protein L17|nr:50S ribosomal protein L17 [Dysgonamonadaceae bacterium]